MLLFQQNTGICTMLGQKGGLYAPLNRLGLRLGFLVYRVQAGTMRSHGWTTAGLINELN
jgi:hypothetical protein